MQEANPMSGVFQKYWPPTPLTARRVCTPRLRCGGRTHSLVGEGGGGVNKDTAMYSTYVSTLWPGSFSSNMESIFKNRNVLLGRLIR
jgi:hypothetical protein